MLTCILDNNNAMEIDLAPLVISSAAPLPPLPFTLRNRMYIRNTYCTEREAVIGVESGDESEADITTDTGSDTEDIIDSDNGGDFDPIGAEDNQINMDII
jgi:hypothetical protein